MADENPSSASTWRSRSVLHVGATREEAIRTGRNPHDEWIRFLAPYGRFRAYTMPDGSPVPFDFRPTIEDSIEQDMMLIGSPEECADLLGRYRDEVGVEHVVLFFDMPGLTQEQMDEQLQMTAEDVLKPGTVEVLCERNTLLDEQWVEKRDIEGVDQIKVRSTITCETRYGVCSHCYGRDRARGDLVNLG